MNIQQIIHEHHQQMGAKGGNATVKKYGRKYMSLLAQKRFAKKRLNKATKSGDNLT